MIVNRMHRSSAGWYTINNRAEDAVETNAADVYIYAEIGDSWFAEGVTAAQFVEDVAGLDVEQINLHLNSPGGDVYDGIAIANVIRQHQAKTTVYVDGLAASAASFIAMAGDEIVMGKNSELMIHDGLGICLGNAADMIEVAGRLDQVSNNIASMYHEKAGGTLAFWRDAMKAETWYTADEAVKAGLADRVVELKRGKNAEGVKNRFDLSIFNYAGRSKAPPPRLLLKPSLRDTANTSLDDTVARLETGEYVIPAKAVRAAGGQITAPKTSPAEPVRSEIPTTEGADTMSDTLTSGLRERLGIPDDAELDDEGLLAAVDEALDEQQPENATTTTEPPPGTVLIEEAVLNDLRASAALGREAREQQLASERNALVDAAVTDGRIAPSRRDHWINALVADPGASDVLASLAKGTVPLAAAGYTGGVDASSDDDLYGKLYGTEAR